jgi:hypothetical protein
VKKLENNRKEKIDLATYYIKLPVSVINEFEDLRAERGWQKSFMVICANCGATRTG